MHFKYNTSNYNNSRPNNQFNNNNKVIDLLQQPAIYVKNIFDYRII